jgi:hypothetical protein
MRIKPVMIAVVFPLLLFGQGQKTVTHKQTNAIYYKWLIGKWRSTEDKEFELLFTRSECIFLYGNDTAGAFHFRYKLSTSCQLQDSLQSSKFNELDKAHDICLVLTSDKDHDLDDCENIQNIDSQTLSWSNVRTLKNAVFIKMAAHPSRPVGRSTR